MTAAAIRACLFDLDGVIVDTAKYHYLAWREIAKELGFAFTEAHNERLKGVSRQRSLEILLEVGGISCDAETREHLAAKKNALYLDHVRKMRPADVLPGAREFVTLCRNQRLRVALVTASKNARTILDLVQIAPLFDAVVDGNKVSKAKPDPEVFLTASRELGVPPAACAVFEDAQAGIEAAIAAGMFSVGIGDPAILDRADMVVPGLAGLTLGAVVAAANRSARHPASITRMGAAP